jgi:hypothetical protein
VEKRDHLLLFTLAPATALLRQTETETSAQSTSELVDPLWDTTGLSDKGYHQTERIRSLEPILHEIERGKGPVRDSDLYFVWIFGTPPDRPWGWRYEGTRAPDPRRGGSAACRLRLANAPPGWLVYTSASEHSCCC